MTNEFDYPVFTVADKEQPFAFSDDEKLLPGEYFLTNDVDILGILIQAGYRSSP